MHNHLMIFLYISLKSLVIFIFCSNYFSSILHHSTYKWFVFIENKDPQIWLPFFNYVIDTVYIYS